LVLDWRRRDSSASELTDLPCSARATVEQRKELRVDRLHLLAEVLKLSLRVGHD
jgi:hypothetical protein